MDAQTLLHIVEAFGAIFVAASIITLCLLGLDFMYNLKLYVRTLWRKFRR